MKRVALALPALLLLGAVAGHMDSQDVLARYTRAMQTVAVPSVVVFSYTVSQTGSNNIEQHHRLYRSGIEVRDETLSINGITLRQKVVRFEQRADRYSIGRFAPSTGAYELLFLGTVKDGRHVDYEYEATPLTRGASAWIDRITIDGVAFLPRRVHFQTQGGTATGSGEIDYAPFGSYWLPVAATATAHVAGTLARERIGWSDYRFPSSLPKSTFQAPQPLPHAALPPI